MLNRSNIFMAILLIVQLVLLAVSALTTTGTENRQTEPILTGMVAADVERFTFSDDLDNSVTAARAAEGWVLPEADDFPVDGEKVDEILEKIAGLDTRRLVASNPANFARLEVKEDDFRRKLTLEAVEASAVIYLGGSGGADTVYARRAGEDSVYLGIGLNSWELSTQASSWLDASYVEVPQGDVLEITVHNAAGSFTFRRAGEDWTYAGLTDDETFEDTKMPSILRNAASLRLLEPLGLEALEEYGLAEPPVTVEVRYQQMIAAEADGDAEGAESGEVEVEYEELSYRLEFGAALDEGVALKASDAEYYVTVRETVFNTFADISRADLIRAPELESEATVESSGG
jgi:hypothetical protein